MVLGAATECREAACDLTEPAGCMHGRLAQEHTADVESPSLGRVTYNGKATTARLRRVASALLRNGTFLAGDSWQSSGVVSAKCRSLKPCAPSRFSVDMDTLGRIGRYMFPHRTNREHRTA
jgi:hypothetical protein